MAKSLFEFFHPGKTQRILGDILLALVIVFTACLCLVMLRRIRLVVLRKDYEKLFVYQLILCGVLLLFALDVRFGFWTALRPKVFQIIGWALRMVFVVLTAVTLFFCGKVAVGGMIRTAAPAERALVLGMALEGGEPTRDLILRVETAQRFLRDNPEASLILTGGNADASGRTEAAVMRDLLAARGVPAERLILEDQASSTKENFSNTARLVDPAAPIVLISSDYHMDRAVRIAGQAGFTRVLRLPAPSDFLAYGASMMSEVVLTLNDLTKGK